MASIRIAAHDRAGLERMLRYCARIHHARPLVCPECGQSIRLIAILTDPFSIRDVLSRAPRRPPSTGCQTAADLHGCNYVSQIYSANLGHVLNGQASLGELAPDLYPDGIEGAPKAPDVHMIPAL